MNGKELTKTLEIYYKYAKKNGLLCTLEDYVPFINPLSRPQFQKRILLECVPLILEKNDAAGDAAERFRGDINLFLGESKDPVASSAMQSFLEELINRGLQLEDPERFSRFVLRSFDEQINQELKELLCTCLFESDDAYNLSFIISYGVDTEYLKKAVSERRKKMKEMALQYLGGQCALCGYSRCKGALHFHHTIADDKGFGISEKGITRSWIKVKDELDKCVLVCANCHREIHDGLTQLPVVTSE